MIGDAVDAILILFKQRMKCVAVAGLAGFDNLSFRHALAHADRLLHRLAVRRASALRRARRIVSSVSPRGRHIPDPHCIITVFCSKWSRWNGLLYFISIKGSYDEGSIAARRPGRRPFFVAVIAAGGVSRHGGERRDSTRR